MAKLYRKQHDSVVFECYSERGIVAHFMYYVLPSDPASFLCQIENGCGQRPFANVATDRISELTVFSELGFGVQGFGSPDGAIFLRIDDEPALLLYEGKLNETYAQSCRRKSYNSTIRGQLELRWRFVRSFFEDSRRKEKRHDYLIETAETAEAYRERDAFYLKRAGIAATSVGSFRRVRVRDGVESFLRYLKDCVRERVFFLVSTSDAANPFLNPRNDLPKTHGAEWKQERARFCWVPNGTIEGR